MNHPDWNAIAAFLDGRLSPKEREDFMRHLLACRACRREIHELSFLRAAWEENVDAEAAEALEAAEVAEVAGRAKSLLRFPVRRNSPDRLIPPRHTTNAR